MEIKELVVRFTENAEEEVNHLVRDMRLLPLVEYLQKTDSPLPQELKESLTSLLAVITDLFSVDLPEIEKDPEITLRTISRDINLARLLRERGLFRLYRLVNEYVYVDEDGTVVDKDDPAALQRVPLYMTYSGFAKQEDFIGWFCQEARVSRGLVFMRLAAIDRMLALGFTLEQAFRLIIAKPYAVQETLASVASWEKGELVSIKPEVAVQLARRIDPLNAKPIEELAAAAQDNHEAMEELKQAVKPLLAELVTEVAAHDRAKDAMDWVRHDILRIPEISYSWDVESNALVVQLVTKQYDSQTGEEYVSQTRTIPFVPDTLDLPKEIRDDLIRRLPIRNRMEILDKH